MKKLLADLDPWLQLGIITTACWTGGIFTTALIRIDASKPGAGTLTNLIVGLIAGIFIALGQGALLRGEMTSHQRWISLTAAGTSLGTVVTMTLIQKIGGSVGWITSGLIAGAVGGILAGVFQSGGLRSHQKKLPFVVFSALIWSLAQCFTLELIGDSAAEIVRAGMNIFVSISALGWTTTGLLAIWALFAITPLPKRPSSGGQDRWWY